MRTQFNLQTASDYALLAQKSPTILQNINSTPACDMSLIIKAMDSFAISPDTREVKLLSLQRSLVNDYCS